VGGCLGDWGSKGGMGGRVPEREWTAIFVGEVMVEVVQFLRRRFALGMCLEKELGAPKGYVESLGGGDMW